MKALTTAVVAFLVIVYAVVGGVVFNLLERDNETAIQQDVNNRIANFIGTRRLYFSSLINSF